MNINHPKCVCGKVATTTIVQMPACAECEAKYAEEGRKYLPNNQRVFFHSFVDRHRAVGTPAAANYSFAVY